MAAGLLEVIIENIDLMLSSGVVHGDISPCNISPCNILYDYGDISIIDFTIGISF